ncbi:hypothetical protein D3C80_2072880 [compost metagenome]
MICSLTPKLKLPRPSNPFGLTPRKSRVRGKATAIKRSKKSYILSPRKVTLVPIGIPLRNLKFDTSFLDIVATAL